MFAAQPSASPCRIVNRNPDTLFVNFKFADENDIPTGAALPDGIIELFNAYQDMARAEHEPIPTEMECNGQTLFIRPHGSDPWSWLLFCGNQDIKLEMGYGKQTGHVFCRARFSSFLLHLDGPDACISMVEDFFHSLLGDTLYHKQVSELHLCVDVVGWDISQIDSHHDFVSRVVGIRERPEVPEEEELEGGLSPRDRMSVEERIEQQLQEGLHQPMLRSDHRKIATIDFGSHGSRISCQIYNKSAEVKKRKKEYFDPIWRKNGWDGKETVIRIEFRMGRPFLRTFDLNEASDVLSRLDQMWSYATQQWLRYVDKSIPQKNLSRYPTHPVWLVIQSAYTLDPASLVNEDQLRALRLHHLVNEKPLELVAQAAHLSAMHEIESSGLIESGELLTQKERAFLVPCMPVSLARFALSVAFLFYVKDYRLSALLRPAMETHATVQRALQEETIDVQRALALDVLSNLTHEDLTLLLDHLSPPDYRLVERSLMKRSRSAGKKNSYIAAAVGNLRSAVALVPPDEFAAGVFGRGSSAFCSVPDPLSSVLWLLEEMRKADEKKERNHREEIFKKRVKYEVSTLAQIEEERKRLDLAALAEEEVRINASLLDLQRPAAARPETDENINDWDVA